MFETPEDRKRQREVADILERVWGCKIIDFGECSPIDWYAKRHNAMISALELKCRKHKSDEHPTVFLSVRKWISLRLIAEEMEVRGIFVVRFSDDQIRWINILEVNPTMNRIAGHRIMRAKNDQEPVFDVPVASMKILNQDRSDAA